MADALFPLPRISSISSSSCLASCLVLRKLFWKVIIHWLPQCTDFGKTLGRWHPIKTKFQGSSAPGPSSWQLLQKRVVAMARRETRLVATDKAWPVSVATCCHMFLQQTLLSDMQIYLLTSEDLLFFEMELLQQSSCVLSLWSSQLYAGLQRFEGLSRGFECRRMFPSRGSGWQARNPSLSAWRPLETNHHTSITLTHVSRSSRVHFILQTPSFVLFNRAIIGSSLLCPMMYLIRLDRLKLQAPQLPQSARRNDAG